MPISISSSTQPYRAAAIGLLIGTSATPAFAAAPVSAPVSAPNASDSAEFEGGEIIVTAERRETTIQKTPLSISAIGGGELQERRLQLLRDLAVEVPSLVTPGMHQNMQSIFIRGIGTTDPGVYPAVGLYIDDVYIPRTFGNGLFDLPDIARVEVLRGPQGTLYGLNTSAGAIKFVSRDPTNETEGHFDAGFGNYGAFEAHGYLSGAIIEDRLSASIAVTHRRRDGYTYNATLDKDVDAIASDQFRFKLRWTPEGPGGAEAVLAIDGTRDRSDNANYVPVGYPGWGPRTTYGNFDQTLRRNIGGVSLRITIPVSDAITLKSIAAYRGFEDNPSPWDQDATPEQRYGWTQYIDQRQFSQEGQILGSFDRLDFVLGVSFFRERLDFVRNSYTNDAYSLLDSHIIDRSIGVYGQATYKITEALSLTAGLRFNKEWQSFDNESYASNLANDRLTLRYRVAGLKDDWTALTPKFSINYQWSDDVLTYASFTRGQKSGGFNRGASTAAIASVAVKPEEVTTYETGLKARVLDNRLRFSLAGFYNSFKDYIATIANPQINGQVILGNVVANAAEAETYGIEGELTANPAPGTEIRFSAAWLETEFGSFANPTGAASSDFTGNQLPSAPRWVIGGSLGQDIAIGTIGDLRLTLRGRHSARAFSDVANRLVVEMGAATIFDLSARFQPNASRWSLSANITNLFDKTYRVTGTVNAALGVNTAGYNPPRLFMASLRYDL